ncbi:MAG TPA: lipoyl(octanoyl) transferase LipB [Stellaceae bacterium]|nr:lipoyl(octanoyl) transferase LipB [Stellaceae bacterium]
MAAGRVEWRVSDAPVPYEEAVAAMEARAAAIRDGAAAQLVWLLEHRPLYTAGTSAQPADLLDPGGLPVYRSGRGGQYTYHGPGQRIAYVLLDLDQWGRDVRCHVWRIEEWMIRVLAEFGVRGERRAGRVGVWVARPDRGDDKIAAIGVRVRRWVTYHGVALNVSPDLAPYRGIVPCGIAPEASGHGVTSLARLGVDVAMAEVDAALRAHFERVFGEVAGSCGA